MTSGHAFTLCTNQVLCANSVTAASLGDEMRDVTSTKAPGLCVAVGPLPLWPQGPVLTSEEGTDPSLPSLQGSGHRFPDTLWRVGSCHKKGRVLGR